MAYIMSPDERCYAQVTIPWDGEVPNTAGAADVANGDALRHINGSLAVENIVIPPRGKTGSRSNLIGQGGRRGANWSVEIPLMSSSGAGVAPDSGPLWEAIFGKAGTVVASTSVTYDFADVVAGLALWLFSDPSGADTHDRVVGGGVVNEFEIRPNLADIATMRVSGAGVYIVNKPNFASLDTGAKCGLTAWPTEPASPAYTGSEMPGDYGSITINSVADFKLQDWTIRGTLGRSLRHAFGNRYPSVPIQGNRVITLDASLFLENTSDVSALRHLAYSKASFDATIVIGDTAAGILTFTCNDMQMPAEEVSDTDAEQILSLNGMTMAATSASVTDEFKAVWT